MENINVGLLGFVSLYAGEYKVYKMPVPAAFVFEVCYDSYKVVVFEVWYYGNFRITFEHTKRLLGGRKNHFVVEY